MRRISVFYFAILFWTQGLFALGTKHWNGLNSSKRPSFFKSKTFPRQWIHPKDQNSLKKKGQHKIKPLLPIHKIKILEKKIKSFPWLQTVSSLYDTKEDFKKMESLFFEIFESDNLSLKKMFIEKLADSLHYKVENDETLKETAMCYTKGKDFQGIIEKGSFKNLCEIIHHILMNPLFPPQYDLTPEKQKSLQVASEKINEVISKISQHTMTAQEFSKKELTDAFLTLIQNSPLPRIMKYYDEFFKTFITQN